MVHVVSEQSGLSGETFPKSAGFVSHIHLERNDGGRSKHTWQVIGQTSGLSHSEQKVQNFFYCWWASLMVQEKLLCSSINFPTGSYYPATAAASALISSGAADLALTVPASSFFYFLLPSKAVWTSLFAMIQMRSDFRLETLLHREIRKVATPSNLSNLCTGNDWDCEGNLRHDGEVHLPCAKGGRPATACGCLLSGSCLTGARSSVPVWNIESLFTNCIFLASENG